MSDLEKLIPQPVNLTVGDETLQVLPIKARQLTAMLQACSSFYHLLDVEGEVDISELLFQGGESVLDAVAIGIGRTREWVDELDMADLIRVATRVIEVNADFFIQAVLPEMEKAKQRMASLNAKRSGLTTSSS